MTRNVFATSLAICLMVAAPAFADNDHGKGHDKDGKHEQEHDGDHDRDHDGRHDNGWHGKKHGKVTVIRVAPPRPIVEVQSVNPFGNGVWTPGYYVWQPTTMRYTWTAGKWVQPPTVKATWYAPTWQVQNGTWTFHPGHWQ
jgi:hypothetical protein